MEHGTFFYIQRASLIIIWCVYFSRVWNSIDDVGARMCAKMYLCDWLSSFGWIVFGVRPHNIYKILKSMFTYVYPIMFSTRVYVKHSPWIDGHYTDYDDYSDLIMIMLQVLLGGPLTGMLYNATYYVNLDLQ